MTVNAVPDPQYFFIIGAMKAGTTQVCISSHFTGHPDLYPSPRKEPRIFRDPGVCLLPRHAQHISGALQGAVPDRDAGASRPRQRTRSIQWSPVCLGAFKRSLRKRGSCISCVIRIERTRLQQEYVHNVAHGRETLSFEQALAKRSAYLDTSRYYMQLRRVSRGITPRIESSCRYIRGDGQGPRRHGWRGVRVSSGSMCPIDRQRRISPTTRAARSAPPGHCSRAVRALGVEELSARSDMAPAQGRGRAASSKGREYSHRTCVPWSRNL